MSKMTKTLLILSLSLLATGLVFVTNLVNVQNAVAFYVALPAGAIFFGLFLISRCLQAETALFDQEQRLAFAAATKAAPQRPCCEPKQAGTVSLASAHAK